MNIIQTILLYTLSITTNFFIFAFGVLFAHCMFDEGILWNTQKKYLLLLLSAIDILSQTFLENLPMRWDLVFLFFLYFLVFSYGCKGQKIRRALLQISIIFSNFCLYILFDMSCYFLLPTYSKAPEATKEHIANFLMLPVFFVLYFYFKKNIYEKGIFLSFRKKEKWMFIFYILYILIMYGMTIPDNGNPSYQMDFLKKVFAIALLLFGILFPFFIFKNRISDYYKNLKDYQETLFLKELAFFQQYKESQEETRRFRHDITKHLICITQMLENENPDEAKAYLKDLLCDIRDLSPKVVTGDEMLDFIFSTKWNLMQQEQIRFQVDGVLDGGLNLKPMDTCSIFANAFDNALEACMKMPPEQPRAIHVLFKRTSQYYYIEIKNTVHENIDCTKLLSFGHYTTKKDSSHHGFGMQTIQRTMQNHDGIFKMNCENNWVTLTFILNRFSAIHDRA